ncbi:hypothetical protein VTJ49DRAFT_283 [Mycothermus thermophilus]|uniref:Uncharacterized protein n=1 Tax=Humicola insolens TaxID=85995 RepID=A0ABR3VGN4_HUMIN
MPSARRKNTQLLNASVDCHTPSRRPCATAFGDLPRVLRSGVSIGMSLFISHLSLFAVFWWSSRPGFRSLAATHPGLPEICSSQALGIFARKVTSFQRGLYGALGMDGGCRNEGTNCQHLRTNGPGLHTPTPAFAAVPGQWRCVRGARLVDDGSLHGSRACDLR